MKALRGLKQVSAQDGTTRLVPYEERFVQPYFEAMQDATLMELTASEPMTLEDVASMRDTWLTDDCMLCLIIVADGGEFLGDVNAILRVDERTCEIDVMVVHRRRQGHASRALALLFDLLKRVEAVEVLEVKIKLHNEPSIALFRKLGFEQQSVSEAFQEVTMTRRL